MLTISGNVGGWYYGYDFDSHNSFKYRTGSSLIDVYSFDQKSLMDFNNHFYTGNLNYTHQFKKDGDELAGNFEGADVSKKMINYNAWLNTSYT